MHINLHSSNTTYNSNFTAGGLFHQEFLALEPIIQSDEIFTLLEYEIQVNKYIAIKSLGARKRIIPQIKARISAVDSSFWDEFYSWSDKEQKLGLFFIVLKTYRLLFELHWEVAHKKYRTGSELDSYTITMFLDELSSRNEEVDSWSEATFKKINSRYRKALSDAGLLKNKQLITPSGIDNSFWEYFKSSNESWFLEACFIKH